MQVDLLTIEQIRTLKRRAEGDIREVIEKLHKATGLCVTGVDFDLVDITAFGDQSRRVAVGDLRIKLETI